MLQRLLIVSLLVLSGCSILQKNPSKTVVPDQIEKLPEVRLNVPVPLKPELKNEMVLMECMNNERKLICVEPDKYRSHLMDLAEILRYQRELENALSAYREFYLSTSP